MSHTTHHTTNHHNNMTTTPHGDRLRERLRQREKRRRKRRRQENRREKREQRRFIFSVVVHGRSLLMEYFFLVNPICARDLSLLSRAKYDSSFISFSASWQVNSFLISAKNLFLCSYSFHFFDFFVLCSYSFEIFRIIWLCSYRFFPELILHKYSVEGYTPTCSVSCTHAVFKRAPVDRQLARRGSNQRWLTGSSRRVTPSLRGARGHLTHVRSVTW